MITLEPACKGGGGDPRWIDWLLKENFNGECLTYQFAAFDKLQREGKITEGTFVNPYLLKSRERVLELRFL